MRRRRKSRPPSGRIAIRRDAVDPIMAITAGSQDRREAAQPLARRLLVVHQRHADLAPGGVDAVGLAAGGAARQPLHMRLAPQLARGLLAVADVEPQEEATARRVVAEAVVQDLLGDLGVLAVPLPRGHGMGLLSPQ